MRYLLVRSVGRVSYLGIGGCVLRKMSMQLKREVCMLLTEKTENYLDDF